MSSVVENRSFSVSEIKRRSLSGTSWLVVMNLLGMPAAFFISIMLGRFGATTLGFYAVIQILISIVTTFIFFGGNTVFTVFIPKIHNIEWRGRFVFSYCLLILVFMGIVLFACWWNPNIIKVLLQREVDMSFFGSFFALAILVVISEMFYSIASGFLLIKFAAISRQVIRFILLPLVATSYFLYPQLLNLYGFYYIIFGFVVGYVISIFINFVGIYKEKNFMLAIGIYFPDGFWSFSIVTMASTIFTFLYANIDKVAVLKTQQVEGLGLYHAVLSIYSFLEQIPNLLLPSLLPAFANLVNHQEVFQRVFLLLSRWIVLIITLISLLLMAMSSFILGLFGVSYQSYDYLLVFFAFLAIVRSLSLPAYIALICQEKNIFRFFQSFFNILAQALLTYILVKQNFGIDGIAAAKIISTGIAALVGIVYVIFSLKILPNFPKIYLVALLIGFLFLSIKIFSEISSYMLLSVFLASIFSFLFLSNVSFEEFKAVLLFFIKRDKSYLKNFKFER